MSNGGLSTHQNNGYGTYIKYKRNPEYLDYRHSVPTDSKGSYIKEEADMLGIRPGSHGCIRLTVPDARWIMQSVPTGTPVLVK